MNKYEAMFLLRADLGKEKTNQLMQQINEIMLKNKVELLSSSVWQENRELAYPIKKQKYATYYLVNFNASPSVLQKLNEEYRLNENILRFMILRII
jgi:small subunit ribosomal protein S6